MKLLNKTLLLFALLFTSVGVFAQQSETEKAIQLYREGNNRGAITALERLSKQKETKQDAKVWNYLGLAYIEVDDLKKARKALEKANSLSPQNSAIKANLGYAYLLSRKLDNAQKQLDEAIRIDPQNALAYYVRGTSFLWERKLDEALADAEKTISLQSAFSSAYILKADVLVAKFGQQVIKGATPQEASAFLRQAIETLEGCVKTCGNNVSLQRERLEAYKAFYEYFNRNKVTSEDLNTAVDANTNTATNDTNATPLKVLSKRPARYTDRARQAGISGTITFYVLFGATGKILGIIPINALGYGLDEEAYRAASQIKFEPATRDGKPVSVVRRVVYSFSIY